MNTMQRMNKRNIVGWIAVSLSLAITCFWAYWGIIENFHEGWFHESLLANVGLMIVQYLSPMLAFMGVALVSIWWPRFGVGLHGIFVIFVFWFFGGASNTAMIFLLIPLLLFALLYWFGRPQPRRVATYLLIGLPLLTLIIFGVEPVLRIAQRVNDGDLGARVLAGNGVTLTWAPDGPGWPREGMDWYAAGEACQYLAEDGMTVMATPQNIWRLPTVDEAVRSMGRHGENSGGVWDAASVQATYQTRPDKESPLWNVYSQVIYWWTATEVDEEDAYIIVYDGNVWPRDKELGPAYFGFRCVKP
ncbi:MAG: hypothetical protein R3C14_15860 [Caldilineaceae bacterium]